MFSTRWPYLPLKEVSLLPYVYFLFLSRWIWFFLACPILVSLIILPLFGRMAVNHVRLKDHGFLNEKCNSRSFLDILSVALFSIPFMGLKFLIFLDCLLFGFWRKRLPLTAPFAFSLVGNFPNRRLFFGCD